jgi:Flp pilus assembly protein TadD
MRARTRLATSVLALVVACSVLLSARVHSSGSAASIQLDLADLLFGHSDYRGAMGVYQRVVAEATEPALLARARAGTIRSALRIAEFRVAAAHAAALRAAAPDDPNALALSGDSLWASGLFDDAEEAYRAAIDRDPALARGRHGMARVLASRNQLQPALDEAEAALAAAPGDAEVQHTVGFVLERLHRFDEAAAAYQRYLDILVPGDRGDGVVHVHSEINFLRSFGNKKPFEIVSRPGIRQHTIPFRLIHDKVIVQARLNGEPVDIAIDTGAEQTVVTARTAKRLDLPVMGVTLSAGVGLIGLRGVQMSRLDSIQLGSFEVRNVPVLIKNPAIEGMPMGEAESLSPLALGVSVTVDYRNRQLTLGAPNHDGTPAAYELPLRMHRLATVQGNVNGEPASFIVDTGGQVISLDRATARSLFQPADRHRIALRVYGSSGLDPDAYLLPGISLAFDAIRLPTQPVVVLNLRAPSVLLGYQIGGIVGHKFLSKYRVEFDMERSVLRLRESG